MTNQLRIALAVGMLLAGSLATEVEAALKLTAPISQETGINDIGNEFGGNIATALTAGSASNVNIYQSNIQATVAGTISFYVLASESGFRNGFLLGPNPDGPADDWWEAGSGSGNDKAWGSGEELVGTLSVAANATLNSLIWFATEGGSPIPAGNLTLSSTQFGIFATSAGVAANDFTTLLFGFDDNGANQDDNHDDLIVKAVFQASPVAAPVPEPSSLLVWGLLASGTAGLAIVRNRRRVAM